MRATQLPKSVPNDDGRATAFVSDHRCDVVCEIVQRQAFHRPPALGAPPRRLRPQHAEAGLGDARCDGIEILRITAAEGMRTTSGPLPSAITSMRTSS
jgi:hypothetical protein